MISKTSKDHLQIQDSHRLSIETSGIVSRITAVGEARLGRVGATAAADKTKTALAVSIMLTLDSSSRARSMGGANL